MGLANGYFCPPKIVSSPNNWGEIQTFGDEIRLESLAGCPTLQSGQIFHYDKRFFLTSANRRAISRSSNVLVTPVTVADTAVETVLWTGTVSPATFAVGKEYRFSVLGRFSTANASDTLTIRVTLNDLEISQLVSNAGVISDVAGSVHSYVSIRAIGVSGLLNCFANFQLHDKTYHADNSSISVDTTTATLFKVTAQWSTALPGNICIANQGFLEALG